MRDLRVTLGLLALLGAAGCDALVGLSGSYSAGGEGGPIGGGRLDGTHLLDPGGDLHHPGLTTERDYLTIAISSTLKTSVAPPGICGGWPCSP